MVDEPHDKIYDETYYETLIHTDRSYDHHFGIIAKITNFSNDLDFDVYCGIDEVLENVK